MKENRRVQYTIGRLNQSLLRFLREKPLSQVKVTELRRDADINRSTYYAHFSNPADQLDRLECRIISDLDAYLDTYLDALIEEPEDTGRAQYYAIKCALDYFQENKAALSVLFSQDVDTGFGIRLFRSAAERVFGASRKETVKHFEFIFAAMGCLGIMQYWLLYERDDADVEDIAQIIITMLQRLESE